MGRNWNRKKIRDQQEKTLSAQAAGFLYKVVVLKYLNCVLHDFLCDGHPG